MAEGNKKGSKLSKLSKVPKVLVQHAVNGTSSETKSGEATEKKVNNEEIKKSVKRLYRSAKNGMIAGVASGLADYFDIDPAVVRLIFVLGTFFGGFGIPVYIILWIILPVDESGTLGSKETIQENTADLRKKAEEFAQSIRGNTSEFRSRTIIGYILIGLGAMFILQNFGFFRTDIFWPLFLVLIGFLILRK